MKKIFALILSVITAFSLLCFTACKTNVNEKVLAVSIEPIKTLVYNVVKDKFNITVAVPNGQSPETYEPTPKEIVALSIAKTYFSVGIPNEKINVLPELNCSVIHLDEEVSKTYPDRFFQSGGRDPHIWLSIKRAIKMVEIIRDKVIELDAVNSAFYTENANTYISLLETTYEEVQNILNGANKKIIVFHPSYGYFTDEFNLEMYALEKDGRELTPKELAEMVGFAKQNGITKIFYQAETDSASAVTFANEINGSAIKLYPLSADYIKNLKEMARAFAS